MFLVTDVIHVVTLPSFFGEVVNQILIDIITIAVTILDFTSFSVQAALHIHNPDIMEGINGFVTSWHALATKSPCHVLRLAKSSFNILGSYFYVSPSLVPIPTV